MLEAKANMHEDRITDFLQNHFNKPINNVDRIYGGEQSQGFFFIVDGEEFVIRINKENEGFEKDKYMYDTFASSDVPIPQVMEIGKMDEKYFYAITKKVPGKILNSYSDEEFTQIFLQVFQVLEHMRNTDISTSQNFGHFTATGEAHFSSWKEFLLSINDEDWFHWERIFEETFFEKTVFEDAYKKLTELVSFCPEERYLVHGDFGGDNVIAQKDEITGIIDWSEALYGDFLYDVAWMDFWNNHALSVKDTFYELSHNKGDNMDHYNERILAYQIRLGLSSLYFYAITNQFEKYVWSRDKLMSVMKQTYSAS